MMEKKNLVLIDRIKSFISKKEGEPNKKKIENLVVFLVILIITIIAINAIWGNDSKSNSKNQNLTDKNKKLATSYGDNMDSIETGINATDEDKMVQKLEDILSKINGVGKVKVMITYSQTSQTIPLYNNDASEKQTEETDKQGGTRKITETDTKTEIIYKEENGEKTPITQKVVQPKIEGAIITAKGANDMTTKTNIIQAVEAATGLATHKIQVFEMN